MKLSAPQERALRAAAEGTLMYAFPQFTGGGYWIKDVWPMRDGNVRPQTGQALRDKALIAIPRREPGRTAVQVRITAAGRAALPSPSSGLPKEGER